MEEQLTPIELNPDSVEQATTDRIMDTRIKKHPPTEDPSISSCQSRPTPSPRQMAHQGSSSAEVSSSNGGTQRNGDHCFFQFLSFHIVLIQVDIGGHPPFLTRSKQFPGNFGNLLF